MDTSTTAAVSDARYTPEKALDLVIAKMGLKNDAALARLLVVAPPLVSKIRGRRTVLTDAVLIRMHEESGLSIKELKAAMGRRPDAGAGEYEPTPQRAE